jgi:hypothetical protein
MGFYVGFAVSIGISRLLIRVGEVCGSAGVLISGVGFPVFVEFWLEGVSI